jgi:hypothetical protein
MFSKLHDRLGTAGLVVAIVALVAALAGTALAAGGLTVQQEKQVKKIAKKYAGKPGATGATGAPGAAGLAGAPGKDGANGAPGADGKSVAVGTPTAAECSAGGATVQVAGEPATKKKVCNGKEGSPWTAGGVLPTGKSETGAWAFGKSPAGVGEELAAISFTIPLSTPIAPANVHFIDKFGKEVVVNETTFDVELVTPTKCLGSREDPSAEPGHLCVYGAELFNAAMYSNFSIVDPGAGTKGAGTTGAVLTPEISETGASGFGTWAVTAP